MPTRRRGLVRRDGKHLSPSPTASLPTTLYRCGVAVNRLVADGRPGARVALLALLAGPARFLQVADGQGREYVTSLSLVRSGVWVGPGTSPNQIEGAG